MKIHWHHNPLRSVVKVDENDKKRILSSIQNDYYVDILCNLDMWLTGTIRKSDEPTLEKVQKEISKWAEITDMEVDHPEVYRYVAYLEKDHMGDCTCLPMTCMKCLAEEALGINTLKGLSSHTANAIRKAFDYPKREGVTIYEALENLKEIPAYNGSEKSIARWEAERKAALEWLEKYLDEHKESIAENRLTNPHLTDFEHRLKQNN